MTRAYTTSLIAGELTVTALGATDRTIYVGPPAPLEAAAAAILRDAGHEPSVEDAAVFARQMFGCFRDGRAPSRTLRAEVVREWCAWRRGRRVCA